jgi:hypothetical protein
MVLGPGKINAFFFCIQTHCGAVYYEFCWGKSFVSSHYGHRLLKVFVNNVVILDDILGKPVVLDHHYDSLWPSFTKYHKVVFNFYRYEKMPF